MYSYLAFSNASMFGGIGGEVSLTYNQLSGNGSATDDDCGLQELIGRFIENCDGDTWVTNDTQIGQLRLLATYNHANSGVQFLGGVGAVDMTSDVRNRLPELGSRSDRSSKYKGLGLVAVARIDFSISNRAVLQLEGFAGIYSGGRDLDITDTYGAVGGRTATSYFSRQER